MPAFVHSLSGAWLSVAVSPGHPRKRMRNVCMHSMWVRGRMLRISWSRKKKVCYVTLREESWLNIPIRKEDHRQPGTGQLRLKTTGKNSDVEEKWAGLTASTTRQMVDSKLLERLLGDTNDLTEATATQERACQLIYF